jgi:hypothetical protein
MARFKEWLIRLPFVVLAAAGMGWFGLILMYLGTPYFPAYDDFWTRYVVIASIFIWGGLSFLLMQRRFEEWLAWGFLSPLLGGILVSPPASFSFIIIKAYVAFPALSCGGLSIS